MIIGNGYTREEKEKGWGYEEKEGKK